jgi:hypothetical protein
VSTAIIALAAVVAAVGISPPEDVARESVDLMELNHFYDKHARHIFDQIIFYDWSADEARYNVRAWRLVKSANQLPQRDWSTGGYSAMWQDGEQVRCVYTKATRETWTQHDPELVEREYLPKERRQELRTVRYDRPAGAIRPPAPPQPLPADELPGPDW